MSDSVEHPDHYNWLKGIECIKVVEQFNYCKGAAIKYIWRSGKKGSSTELEDLRKAKKHLEFEIARLEKEEEVGISPRFADLGKSLKEKLTSYTVDDSVIHRGN